MSAVPNPLVVHMTVAADMVTVPMSVSVIGRSTNVQPREFTENGEYQAPDGVAYNPVTVKVELHPNLETVERDFTQNGSYEIEPSEGYDGIGRVHGAVSVPNTYGPGDEGKVVNNGALVAQTARTVTSNGTVDTTLNNSVTVDVPVPTLTSLNAPSNGTYTSPAGTAWNEVVVTADLLEKATQVVNLFRSATNMPMEITINAPSAKVVTNVFYYAASIGTPEDAKATVIFNDAATSFESAFQACFSAYRNICLKGSTKNVTNFNLSFYLSQATLTDDSDPIDLTSATAMKNMFGYQYGIANLRFKPNTRSLSVGTANAEGINVNQVHNSMNWAIVSYANSLIAANGATKYCACSGWNSKLTTIMGRVESRTDETGTYDFFVEDVSGAYSVADFITNVKGWAIV